MNNYRRVKTVVENRKTGETKSAGFQVGARRSFPIAPGVAWRILTSPESVGFWLGESVEPLRFEPGAEYQLQDGSKGRIRVYVPNHHMRLTWQPAIWARASTIQVRVIPSGEKTVVAFHQEHLPSAEAREQRKAHFHAVLDRFEYLVASTLDRAEY